MRLLITAGASAPSQFLADILGRRHTVRLTERIPLSVRTEFVHSPLGHDHGTHLLVRGMETIIHVLEPLPADGIAEGIDYATRATYNLLWAAAEEGVPHVVLLSSLALLSAYPAAYAVGERWRPLPSPRPESLIPYLAECTCKEFAREARIGVTVLRLGTVYPVGEAAEEDEMGVDIRDVAQAVERALSPASPRWRIFHIQHDGPGARFPVAEARRVLGYQPAAWQADSHGFSTGRR